jgi:hypothetical protein
MRSRLTIKEERRAIANTTRGCRAGVMTHPADPAGVDLAEFLRIGAANLPYAPRLPRVDHGLA